ncbi:unnamed protein product [Colias eurytheme]|nr:unnamed protein product [Colias eurytheme]
MGSTSFGNKSKLNGFRAKSSSIGSDKEMNGKLKRNKLRRPTRMNDYGLKRIPDYTDLAYKEAVSKLRYFLSGNSAPSVRSYGGSPSLKNLDDSDADIDKKYPFNLAEYKPRPRLTAKYTTLYADSLNNYTPPAPTSNVPPPTNTSDLTGGTNPDVVNFIQKQEEYIEQLERESQYCREELNNLLGKVKEVISENENLHEAQKNKMISRMFHTYNGSETDDLDDVGDSTGLDSDNKGTPHKNRRPRSRSTKLEGPNIVFESRIAELEAQLTQAKIDLKKVQEENNENKRKLANGLVDSTCLDGFKRQIDNLQRDKNALENQISKLKLSLEQRDSDVDGRYKRGSEAIENQLREERNNLEAEIRRLKDELSNERSKVRSLSSETSRRALHERSAAEQRYTQHFDELRHELAAQCDNVAKLQLDLERQRREESELKREISMKNAAIEELKMELKNKTASLQADLAQAYAEKASLEEELASARLTIERNQRQAKHESNRLNSEIHSLRQRLDRSDADLVHSRRENLRLSEQISNLEKEINMKTLTPISPEKNKKEKEISSALESIENKHGRAQRRSRVDEPIRTQRDRSSSGDQPIANRSKRRVKESDSSNNYPIVVGPLTTNQDLTNTHGERIYNLPLMIQQPFLREKKEPIKVDISVKLIPKPKKRDRKKREAPVEEIRPDNKGVNSSISMEVTDSNIRVLKESVEVYDGNTDILNVGPMEEITKNTVESENKEPDITTKKEEVAEDKIINNEVSDTNVQINISAGSQLNESNSDGDNVESSTNVEHTNIDEYKESNDTNQDDCESTKENN